MSGLQQATNQELIRELEIRIKDKKIKEREISRLLEIKKKQRLTEYEAAAKDTDENEESEDWGVVETENWDA